MIRLRTVFGIGIALLTLAGCSSDAPRLMNLRAQADGPDEFAIVPTRPLEMPDDMSALPPPAPGGANLADPDPGADAIAALGGNVNRGAGGSAGLMNHVGRFGVAAGIRNTLAAEDLEYRRDNDGRLLERAFAVNIYHRAYEDLSLDQYAELARLRRAGIRTPAAPPNPQE